MASRTIAVTGIAGLLGQRLLPLLDGDGGVTRVVGLDVREPARRAGKLDMRHVDVTSSDLAPELRGCDTVVHLAAIVGPTADESLMARVNVDGTRRVLDAAAGAGVRHVVRASSAAVYGAWPNNPVPLTEDAPLRPNPGFAPATHDAECERLVGEWRRGGGWTATLLRIAPVVGPGSSSLFARVATGHPPVVVRGAAPPVQVTHVDDAASALALAAGSGLDGTYNVASSEWLSHDDALALFPSRRLPGLPYELAERALGALWASGLGDTPPTVLPYLVHPWVIANDKLRAEGWAPRHTNEEALLLASPADGHRGALPWVAAVGAVLAGAAGATVWLRRRRR
jgi:nucleoside-diphosphate-sugar epimerase